MPIKPLQKSFLVLYEAVQATGIFNTAWGRSLFETGYFFYKNHYEAKSIALLQQYIKPDSLVIDVGANIGFFTLHLARWVTGTGKVIAIEPETINYERLQRQLVRAGIIEQVETIKGAVANQRGSTFLELNPLHPGDHKLSRNGQGISVPVTTIDALVEAHNWQTVSFIKIDVQGAESLVLAGAEETLNRFRPVLMIEVGNDYLKQYGSSTQALLTFLFDRGYTGHLLQKDTVSSSLTLSTVLQIEQERGYLDVIFLPC